jgi:hypothetical protein
MSEETFIHIPLDFLFDSVCEKFKLGATADDIKAYLRRSGVNEATVENLLQRYFNEQKMREQDHVLSDQPPMDNWYGGAGAETSCHWGRLKDVLVSKKNWSTDMIESLDTSSTSVVAKLANPKLASLCGTQHVKGLVLGYVQSGKTANYSAVAAKAIDAGYRFVVVLAGIHNNLRYQTEARLKEEIVGPNDTTCITLTRTDKNGDFSKKESISANKACGQPQGFSLAVIKKNASVLRDIPSR